MSEEDQQGRSTPWMAICLGLGIGAALLAIAMSPKPERRGIITICKNHLKQLGLVMQSYYSDGTSLKLPIIRDPHITADTGGLGFDGSMLTCPARHYDQQFHYLWNLKASGGKWADWNNPHSPMIWDTSPHKFNNKVNVLFGDGHVEEMTPERLKELTK